MDISCERSDSRYKLTSFLVKALHQSPNVGFEGLLGTQRESIAPLQVVGVISGDLLHPVLFEYCFLTDAVKVKHLGPYSQSILSYR